MKKILLVCLLVACLVSPAMAAKKGRESLGAVPGQLTTLTVEGGYHTAGTFIVLKGQTDGVEGGVAGQTVIWMNGFSTIVQPDGRFALIFPLAALHIPKDDRGTIVTLLAKQYGTNVTLESHFDLAALNRLLDRPINKERLLLMQD